MKSITLNRRRFNGTASRETERFIRSAEAVPESDRTEKRSSASVGSLLPAGSAGVPGSDVLLRGAVLIARRLQDPLASW
ncbi:hypothetical protein ACLB1E_08725 [Escherichia coli]